MLDLLCELIFDIILEGSVELLGNKKVPMALRVIACLILVVVFVGVVAICFLIFLDGLQAEDTLKAIVGAILTVVVTVLLIFGFRNILKRKSDK